MSSTYFFDEPTQVTTTMAMKVDVWSDVVCPFCYLGKRKLEKALKKLSLTEAVIVEWHSFQLDPSFPKNVGLPATENLAKRKGMSIESIGQIQHSLVEQGQEYGIDFQFQKSINFNTYDVHRILHWAKAFSKADVVKTALLKAHFTDGIDLSVLENVKHVVSEVGLNGEAAIQVLNSDDYSLEFQKDIALAQQIGIRGVPFFVFNNKTAISGAQADSIFEDVIQKVMSEER